MRWTSQFFPWRSGMRGVRGVRSWWCGIALGAMMLLAMRAALALPTEKYSKQSFEEGLASAASVTGDTARDHLTRAAGWLSPVDRVFEGTLKQLLDNVEEFERRLWALPRGSSSRWERNLLYDSLGRLDQLIPLYKKLLRRLDRVNEALEAGLAATTEGLALRSSRTAGLRCCHPHLLSYSETHAVWAEVLGAFDEVAVGEIKLIDGAAEALEGTHGAAGTKAGKKASRLIGVVDRLSENAVEHRARITLADSVEQSVLFDKRPTRSDRRLARNVKRPFKAYANYVIALQRLREKVEALVARAVEQVGGDDPVGETCEPTWDFQPDRGGGYIEVRVSGGETRRYPAVANVSLRSGSGRIVVAGAGGQYEEDLVWLGLDAAALQGPGTYAAAVEGDPLDGAKPRFIFDTRGPDGDPHPEGNSLSDWERDVLSGSVTLSEVDWDPASRTLSGTFTFETEFLTNPEEFRDPRTITGSFHCCGFDLFDADGNYSPPIR